MRNLPLFKVFCFLSLCSLNLFLFYLFYFNEADSSSALYFYYLPHSGNVCLIVRYEHYHIIGNDRILTYNEHIRKQIQTTFHQLNHPILSWIVQKIVNQIHIKCKSCLFISVHVRSKDGKFGDKFNQTIQEMTLKLSKLNQKILLYIATDYENHQDSTHFLPLREIAFLTTSLQDYPIHPSIHVNHYSKLTDLFELQPRFYLHQVQENTIWIPLIEQYIASKSDGFIGTSGSTFSDLIYRIHSLKSSVLNELV